MSNIKLKGIIPALISPINQDGSIRYDSLRKLLCWELSHGVSGFYVCGSTGEGIIMTAESRKDMLETVMDEVGGKCTVTAHIGAANFNETIELAKHAESVGATAISSVPPIYFKYTEDEIYSYYKAISDACSLPLLMYGIALSGNNLTVYMVKKLMEIENVIGLKWTYPDYFSLQQIKTINNGDINVVNGPDETLCCGLMMGADAGIGSTYNLMPGLYVKLYNAMRASDIELARKLQYAINAVTAVLVKNSTLAAIKLQLTAMGFDVGECLNPRAPIAPEKQDELLKSLALVDYERQELL
ncbi:MAG: dihydrodipicolinate synthase family protein [Clostridiales bacterium]|nr:dihydrodipicolinate synthase family protein [Clostridiales bacterium]